MVNTKLTNDKSQAGFTLVELAIVMIIIGLLIGGILKGQELIANAQVTATSGQIKSYEAALNTFRDAYSAVPGDMQAPQTRLPNCTQAPCNRVGNGNGRLTETPSVAADAALGTESGAFFVQLAAADLIGGVDYRSTSPTWGNGLPAAESGGGFTVGFANTVANLTGVNAAAVVNSGHYLSLRADGATAVAAGAGNASLKPTTAARIDRKLDDGIPNGGSVLGAGTGGAGGCYNGNAYEEAIATNQCQLFARIQ